ncbi:hypothetical protein [Sphingomonas sp. UYP23]
MDIQMSTMRRPPAGAGQASSVNRDVRLGEAGKAPARGVGFRIRPVAAPTASGVGRSTKHSSRKATDPEKIISPSVWVSFAMSFWLPRDREINRTASGDTAMHMLDLQPTGYAVLHPIAQRCRTGLPNTARANALTALNCALEAAQRWTKVDPSALDEIQEALDLARDAVRTLHALG